MSKGKKIRFEVYGTIRLATKNVVYANTAEEAVKKVLEKLVEDDNRIVPTPGLVYEANLFTLSKGASDSAQFNAVLIDESSLKNFKFKLSKHGDKIGEAEGTFKDGKAMFSTLKVNSFEEG